MSTFGFQTGMTLKALLENPNLQNPLLAVNDSEKKDGSESPQFDMGSAFLGPNLWDKTYDMDDFKLEYMDLDEFLSENGIPVAPEEAGQPGHGSSPVQPPAPPQAPRGPSPPAPQPSPAVAQRSPPQHSPERITTPVSPVSALPNPCPSDGGEERAAPQFDVNDNELALAKIPGQDDFDPRKHKFTDDDLKPQPMIKKSRKVFVPDCAKDDRYWSRRKKNNVAAKRSRDARRVKENQIAMRASYLERENTSMKEEVEKLRRENSRLKTALSKYEKQS